MALIRKPGRRRPDSSSSFRSIYLLEEIEKILKRIVVYRINDHLSQISPDAVDNQFGFREERSTIDAIDNVINYAQSVVSQGWVALAVSIDIVKAFNSLPWNRINRALPRHGLSQYLRNIIPNYHSERSIV